MHRMTDQELADFRTQCMKAMATDISVAMAGDYLTSLMGEIGDSLFELPNYWQKLHPSNLFALAEEVQRLRALPESEQPDFKKAKEEVELLAAKAKADAEMAEKADAALAAKLAAEEAEAAEKAKLEAEAAMAAAEQAKLEELAKADAEAAAKVEVQADVAVETDVKVAEEVSSDPVDAPVVSEKKASKKNK